jgi:hypothetical protein
MPLLNELVMRVERSDSSDNIPSVQIASSQLKKLSTFKIDGTYFTDLMGKISATLEVLELGNKHSPAVYEFVFKNLPKLSFLKINMENLSLENENEQILVETLRTHEGVKTLMLLTKENYDFAQVFISKLPNIESLVLDFFMNTGDFNSLMSFIAANLRNLRVLEIRKFENSTVISYIPSLQELKIYWLKSSSTPDWLAITQGCPNLEILSIGSIGNPLLLSETVIEVLCQNLRKLKKLFIGYGFKATKGIFDLLKTCPSLKNVTILKTAIDDDPIMIEDFTKTGPQIVLLDAFPSNLRTDFITWTGEDVNPEPYEDIAFEIDSDEYYNFGFEHDDSDDEFVFEWENWSRPVDRINTIFNF